MFHEGIMEIGYLHNDGSWLEWQDDYISANRRHLKEHLAHDKITHWMPLPEPPNRNQLTEKEFDEASRRKENELAKAMGQSYELQCRDLHMANCALKNHVAVLESQLTSAQEEGARSFLKYLCEAYGDLEDVWKLEQEEEIQLWLASKGKENA